MTDRHAAVLYAVTFVPAGGVAVALSAWVMDRSGNGAPRMPSGLDGWALNVVPPGGWIWQSIIAIIGACILIFVYRLVRGRKA